MKTIAFMKKFSFLLIGMFAILAISSCTKSEDNASQNGAMELSFNIIPGQSPYGLKAGDCFSNKGSYAVATLQKAGASAAVDYRIDIFYIGNDAYTNTIKVEPGVYTLADFVMWNDNMTPNNPNDDWVMAAAVHAGAQYANLVTSTLNKDITVEAFKKNVMSVELVCYEPSTYTNFGFEFFKLDQTVIREQNFFGDFCIKEVKDYNGTNTPGVTSPYVTVLGGAGNVLLDLPAIFKIDVYRNGTFVTSYNNNSVAGISQPLKIQYADAEGVVDNYEFKLSIMVRVGGGFDYVLFHTWTFTDAQKIAAGTDGVVDFALGNCVPDADLVIPPWMNLPATATYQITGGYGPGSLGGYVDATLGVSGTALTYDFASGVYASWCANRNITITTGTYTMDVYSSLYKNKLPTWAQTDYTKWEKMNWIINHLDWYPGYFWYDLQQAMWKLEDPAWNGQAHSGVPAIGVKGTQMFNDANTYGSGYKVPSGGWACIIFIDHATGNAPNAITQTMFIKVDP